MTRSPILVEEKIILIFIKGGKKDFIQAGATGMGFVAGRVWAQL